VLYGPLKHSPDAHKRLRRLRRAFARITNRYERSFSRRRNRLDWGLYVVIAVCSFVLVWLWLDNGAAPRR
jgi:hypothetical protein